MESQVFKEAQNVEVVPNHIHQINNKFWSTISSQLLGITSLPDCSDYIMEKKLNLFGNLSGKKVLEIGCDNGHLLKFVNI